MTPLLTVLSVAGQQLASQSLASRGCSPAPEAAGEIIAKNKKRAKIRA
jgi:hypothetical protein